MNQELFFEWDEDKNRSNRSKHRVSFTTAAAIFHSTIIESVDDREEYGEVRYVALGRVEALVLRVVYTRRDGNTVRIISAQKAKKHEQEAYYRTTLAE